MDEQLLHLSQKRMITKLSRQSLRGLEKSGHHNVPGRNQEVSGVVHSASVCVICQHHCTKERERQIGVWNVHDACADGMCVCTVTFHN